MVQKRVTLTVLCASVRPSSYEGIDYIQSPWMHNRVVEQRVSIDASCVDIHASLYEGIYNVQSPRKRNGVVEEWVPLGVFCINVSASLCEGLHNQELASNDRPVERQLAVGTLQVNVRRFGQG